MSGQTDRYFADPRPDVLGVFDPAGMRILDVGCGEGNLGRDLLLRGAREVVGIEINESAARRASAVLDHVHIASVNDVDLRDQQFDAVVFADVLEHLADPETTLKQVLRSLMPGGKVLISVPNNRFYVALWRLAIDRWEYADRGIYDRTHLRLFTRSSLLALLQRADLRVLSMTRRYRLVEDQRGIGRVGVTLTKLATRVMPRLPARDLFVYQYLVVAERHSD